MEKTVLSELASLIVARRNCIEMGNTEWESNHSDKIEDIVKNSLPSGSGFDSGFSLDLDESDGKQKIVLNTSYHHMDEHGYYSGWSYSKITITPQFSGIAYEIDTDFSGVGQGEPHDCSEHENEYGECDQYHGVYIGDHDDYVIETLDYSLSQQYPA